MPQYPRPDDVARAAASDPPEPIYTEANTVGTVKYWRDDKGYGAISSDATAPWDIWCHFSALEMEGFKGLSPGERVAVHYYRVNRESFRYVARRVRRIDTTAG
jgi:CspA family cold shock protein